VGDSVIVYVNERPSPFLCGRIELLHEVDPAVEVPIGFAANKSAAGVELFDIGLAVKVGVDVDFAQLSMIVVPLPDVGLSVSVTVLGRDATGGARKRERSRHCARNDTPGGNTSRG